MLRAEKEGLTPEQLIERVHGEHLRDFTAFGVAFDNYHSTHSAENRFYAEDIYGKLKAGGLIDTRSIEQYYDPVKEMFLPDRFIKGECPKCGAADQYGDNCEACGAAYAPTELKNPYSAVSGAKPVLEDLGALLLPPLGRARGRLPARMDARHQRRRRAPPADGSRQQDEGMARRGGREQALRLGHLARRALLRLRDPGRAGQVLLCVARRADRLPRQLPQPRRQARRRGRDDCPRGLHRRRPRRRGRHRDGALHRQGHPLLPRPVLARDAEVRRLRHAQPAVRERLPDRRRRQDRARAAAPSSPRTPTSPRSSTPSGCATTSPASPTAPWRTSTSTSTT